MEIPPQVATPPDASENMLCMICDRKIAEDSRCPLACSHGFCRECVADYLAEKVRNRYIGAISCPKHRCAALLSEQLLEQLLDAEIYQKLLRYRRESELEKDPTLRYCPRPGCLGFDHRRTQRKLTCPLCHYDYCGDCQSAWHARGKCSIVQHEAKFLEWKRARGAKFCPGCRVTVEKNGGCSSMTCNRCSHRWCWYCGKKSNGGHICTSLPLSVCLLIFSIPLLLPFAFIIFSIYFVFNARSEMPSATRARLGHCFYCLVFLAFLLSLVLTPLALALVPIVSGFIFLVPCLEGRSSRNKCCSVLICLLIVPAGLILGPIVTVMGLSIVALCPVIGLVLMGVKLAGKFCKCKCCRCVMGEEGYPLG